MSRERREAAIAEAWRSRAPWLRPEEREVIDDSIRHEIDLMLERAYELGFGHAQEDVRKALGIVR